MSAGLYIHIPFCAKKCKYCDFVSFADAKDTKSYMRALKMEIRLRARDADFTDFDSVFFGGGTPSLLAAEEIASCLKLAQESFSIKPDAEITLEANPGTLSKEKLHSYKQAGINRLSIGLQSADDRLLKRIGRIHDYQSFLDTYHAARENGFNNINIDLMYALPDQSVKDYADTLEKVCDLRPEHISAYSLILEEGTPLYDEHPALPDEDESFAMHTLSREVLSSRAYKRYEISNYALSQRECRHNLHYWNMDPYLGLGLNAHSAWKRHGEWLRFSNTANLDEYIGKCKAEELALAECTSIQRREEMFEFVMLGLRKTQGIRLFDFEERFGDAFFHSYPEAVSALKKRGWLCTDSKSGFFALNETGLDLQNEALLCFMD